MSFSVFDILAKRAELGPDRIAMEDILHGDRVTYRELNLRTGRTTALLNSLGLKQGDRVALLCRNRIEFFELVAPLVNEAGRAAGELVERGFVSRLPRRVV